MYKIKTLTESVVTKNLNIIDIVMLLNSFTDILNNINVEKLQFNRK